MLFVDNQNQHDPAINLALEEYLIRNIAPTEELLLFYINEPSIIIGRHQNTIAEINVEYVREQGLHVVRRLSGGGAVYHDLGNLNFSFIAPNVGGNFANFQKFTAPVIQVLRDLGVPAELSGRNDILAEGRKISGNAQYVSGARIVSHGTLLYNTDLEEIGKALRVKASKIESKGIKSVRSRVANITEFLTEPVDILSFRRQVLLGVFQGHHNAFSAAEIPEYQLTPLDWETVRQLARERYKSWEWNYGSSPAFNLQRSVRYAGGEIEVYLIAQKGVLQSIKFIGDFFGQRDIAELEERLVGCAYLPETLEERLTAFDINQYFAGFSSAELLSLLY
ncbi:MAG: lipoate--protein ligase [Chloroflexi bacterium]|nr:lipoate--protein ligase [Chloroflexota bacterium]